MDCRNKRNGNGRPEAKNAEDVSLCAVESFTDVQEALQAENNTSGEKWCLDSGATSHLCKELRDFAKLNNSKCGKLNLASKDSTTIDGKGTASFNTDVNGSVKSVTLNNVLYVPDLRQNLLSVAKITDRNCEVIFDKHQAAVIDSNGNHKLTADRVGDLYYVREIEQKKFQNVCEEPSVAESPLKNSEMWHRRFGHINAHDLRKAERSGAVSGLNLGKCDRKFECEICQLVKMTKTTFPKRSERKTELLELIHSDLCGPMRVESKAKVKYFMTFIDDYSRCCEVKFLKKKSEAFQAFKDYRTLVENQKEKKVKCLLSDNGTEYLNREFDEYMKKYGIQRRLTIAHNPEQNGISERKN